MKYSVKLRNILMVVMATIALSACATATKQTGDIMNSLYRTYYPSLDIQYTFQRQLDPIGTDGRFLSKEILCRGQVKDSSSTTRVDVGDTIEYSYIDHDNHTDYNASSPPRPSGVKSSNLILGVRHNRLIILLMFLVWCHRLQT